MSKGKQEATRAETVNENKMRLYRQHWNSLRLQSVNRLVNPFHERQVVRQMARSRHLSLHRIGRGSILHQRAVGTVCPVSLNVERPFLQQITPWCAVDRARSLFTTVNEANGAEMDEAMFHEIADDLLEGLETELVELERRLSSTDFDVVNAQGVLTLSLGEMGTWVINKQTPNRQVWWSSPISGPKRFHYVDSLGKWANTKDSSITLVELLEKEIEEKTKAGFVLQL